MGLWDNYRILIGVKDDVDDAKFIQRILGSLTKYSFNKSPIVYHSATEYKSNALVNYKRLKYRFIVFRDLY